MIPSDAARHRVAPRMLRRALLIIGATCVSGTAVAEESKTALAQALFDEGRSLLRENRYAEACPKLAESQALEPAPGTLLNLAVCHEGEGKLATAWGEFTQVLSEAKRDGRNDRKEIAEEHLHALESRVPKLTVDVPFGSRVNGLEVWLKGLALRPSSWNVQIPVNPGELEIMAKAPGRREYVAQVQCAEGTPCGVTIPVLAELPKPPSRPPVAKPVVQRRVLPQPVAEPDTGRRDAAYVAAGVGIVALGVGTFFGLRAKSQWNDANDHCPDNVCDSQGSSLSHDALTSARVADVGIGLGVVGLGVAGYLVLTGPSSSETRGGVAITPARARVSATMSW